MTVAKYTSGYFRNTPESLLISPSHAARSNAAAGCTSPMCVCGFSLEKSGDLSSSSARTAVLVRTFSNDGTARLYSRSVSSHKTRAMASWSFPSGRLPEFTPLGRLCPCVLSSSGKPTRMFTSAKRLWATVSVSRLP